MKTALVIMAAGIGSRFGGGIKQLEKVDDNGHIIMDYSVHDAVEAGFDKVIFVIRKDIEKEFKDIIGDRIEKECGIEVAYAFQDINDIPGELPAGRTKPWGTCQAVLAAKELIDTPFCVINADDYYGKEGFKVVHDELVKGNDEYCMAGFVLKNTLSDNGGVTRGVCNMENGYLTDVQETSNIIKTAEGAEADGKKIDVESLVSMNFWGFTPDFIGVMEEGFKKFFKDVVPTNPEKCEFLIPTFVGELLEQGKVKVKVLKSNDTWYGMTYKEDVPVVKESFKEMIESGKYKADLYEDLH
ncbi:MAG: nucleotidyltransferase [Lachnospiraceae bacterium]|nr:nucleotidyltransferase [Lachnospiraceae bacterium]